MNKLKEAYFAGGCFWCIEAPLQSLDGVEEVISGYIGDSAETANYEDVSTGKTKHREAVKVIYNPEIISFEKLAKLFMAQIDPTDPGGQFADRGYQYTTAVYYQNEEEKNILKKIILETEKKFQKIVATKILPVEKFYPAEEYHQDFFLKSEEYYKRYKKGSGREDFISDNWAKELAILESRKEKEKK